ncbi:MAG: DUF2029 domain-containing protein [Actinobacteria bacterium]|nr:MAG: DUF2029 domain-containing protein [Actinomycetota bacterium]
MAAPDRRTTIAAIAAGCILLAAATALPRIGLAHGPIGTSLFQSYGDRTMSGQVPYRDFSLEYPPGAVPAFVVPSLGPARHYDTLFELFELACGLGCIALTALAVESLGGSVWMLWLTVAYVALAPLALGPVTLHRYDLWPTAFLVGGVAALLSGRARIASAALGAGTAAKVFPVVLVPLALLYLRRRERLPAASWFVLVCGAIVLPFFVLAPGGVGFSIWHQIQRPLQIESIGAALLLVAHALGLYSPHVAFGSGSWNLVGALPRAIAAVQSVLLAAGLVFVWRRFARGRRTCDGLVLASTAAIATWIVFGKVLSPQFLLWLLPLVALSGRRAPAFLLLAALGLTHAVYPDRYDALIQLHALPIAQSQHEHRERVEVIELHRQVEDVRRHRRRERRRHPPCERPHARRGGLAERSQRASDRARSAQSCEQVAQEDEERDRPDHAGLHDQRDVERMRAPVRLAGDELVVDREGVEPESEQRMRVQYLRNEVVDGKVRTLRPSAGVQA